MDEPRQPAAPPPPQDDQSLHRRMVYETACALAESASLAEAAPRMLQAVCVALGWEFGALWQVDHARTSLRFVASWRLQSTAFEAFNQKSRHTRFAPGVGLPGRVWATARPAWIHSLADDPNFPRAPFARQVGLQSAFGMPILRGQDVLGVMEFFSREIRQPVPELLATLGTIGAQIGVYVDRKRASEELDRFFELSLDLLGIANFDGYFVRVNPTWERVLGVTAETVMARPFLDFVHPDDRKPTIEAMSSLLALSLERTSIRS